MVDGIEKKVEGVAARIARMDGSSYPRASDKYLDLLESIRFTGKQGLVLSSLDDDVLHRESLDTVPVRLENGTTDKDRSDKIQITSTLFGYSFERDNHLRIEANELYKFLGSDYRRHVNFIRTLLSEDYSSPTSVTVDRFRNKARSLILNNNLSSPIELSVTQKDGRSEFGADLLARLAFPHNAEMLARYVERKTAGLKLGRPVIQIHFLLPSGLDMIKGTDNVRFALGYLGSGDLRQKYPTTIDIGGSLYERGIARGVEKKSYSR